MQSPWNRLTTVVCLTGLLLMACEPQNVDLDAPSAGERSTDRESARSTATSRAEVDDLPETPLVTAQQDPAPADVSSDGAPTGPRDVARVGAGRKGRGYGGGIISEPARQMFRIRERVIFDVQIPQAMNAMKASDPRGRGPQTHDEFMEKVIKQNGITLPELPPGQTYVYDPETETLMVQRPAN